VILLKTFKNRTDPKRLNYLPSSLHLASYLHSHLNLQVHGDSEGNLSE